MGRQKEQGARIPQVSHSLCPPIVQWDDEAAASTKLQAAGATAPAGTKIWPQVPEGGRPKTPGVPGRPGCST